MQRHETSNIQVLVVGAGLGGLYTAIELHRQGHSVQILESKAKLGQVGDFVGIGRSVTKQFEKWPGMAATYSSIIYRPDLYLLTHDGISIGGPFPLSETSDYRPVPVSRPKLIGALYDYVVSLDIPVFFSKRVVQYEESDVDKRASAITDQGEKFYADIIVAADGIGTKTGTVMEEEEDEVETFSSGHSIYRVTYPTSVLRENSFLAQQYPLAPGQPDYCEVYICPQGNMIILVSPETTTWLFTHEDKGAADETWSTKLNASDVLETVRETGVDWDPRCLEIIKQTPAKSVIDYKITFRDPNPHWSSKGGRIIKVGDAAHAFIPNSSNGATQAMEDGQSIAACLRLAGKNNIALATRIHTKLRFERTSCAQRNGFRNRDKWQTNDYEAVKLNPHAAVKSIGRWLSNHDPEQYVYDNWYQCLNHLVSGSAFRNTNIPPGYEYEPWTMSGLMAQNGHADTDAGDWD